MKLKTTDARQILRYVWESLVSLVVLLVPQQVGAQAADSVVVTAGAHYQSGALHRLILGRHYRDVWATPMRVPILDLASFAGGLQPLRRGGGRQTKSLRFMGADGREYSFRSVDKDPSAVLDSLLRETIIADLVQDGISSAHPLGALVAAPLLDAVEVLHVDPQLWVMPDDPTLGEFRSDFAGVLGLMEENADENAGGSTSFRGAERVVGSTTLMARIDGGAADAVDARAFLTARIVDLFLGDWDRHRDQWRWATFDTGDQRNWLPVPKDRDQAFSKFDGLAPRLVNFFMPQFVRFGPSYPNIVRLHWNGRELDRRFLSGLDRPVWDSIGGWVQDRLTDEVIEEAVNRLPPEILAVGGEELRSNLMQRRNRLTGAWTEFYAILSEKVDVHGTDADGVVIIDRTDPKSVVLSIWSPVFGDAPYLQRRFDAGETSEIRLYLKGGSDRVAVRGSGGGGITIRIIGGEGDDRYQFEGSTVGLRLYDDHGHDTVSGTGTIAIDRTPFEEWVWMEEDRDQPRDWGKRWTPVFWSSFASDAVRASGLDVIHYYGLGNDSGGGPEDLHQVDERTVSVAPGVGLSWNSGVTVEAGIIASATSASDSEAGFFAGVAGTLYGATGHSQFGARTRVSYHPHADQPDRRARVRAAAEGTLYPTMADVESTFQTAEGEISALHPRIRGKRRPRGRGTEDLGTLPMEGSRVPRGDVDAARLGRAALRRGRIDLRTGGGSTPDFPADGHRAGGDGRVRIHGRRAGLRERSLTGRVAHIGGRGYLVHSTGPAHYAEGRPWSQRRGDQVLCEPRMACSGTA